MLIIGTNLGYCPFFNPDFFPFTITAVSSTQYKVIHRRCLGQLTNRKWDKGKQVHLHSASSPNASHRISAPVPRDLDRMHAAVLTLDGSILQRGTLLDGRLGLVKQRESSWESIYRRLETLVKTFSTKR